MKLDDALFNWLQMKIVYDHRPDDRAAKDTLDFFEMILREDHHLERFEIERSDDRYYYVAIDGKTGPDTKKFDREMADQLLIDINSNPKFN
jgi:hypothetical protein